MSTQQPLCEYCILYIVYVTLITNRTVRNAKCRNNIYYIHLGHCEQRCVVISCAAAVRLVGLPRL